MRWFIVLAWLALAIPSLADVEVVVTLRNGATVDSRISAGEIVVAATFGNATIDADHLASIEFGRHATNDTILTGDGTRILGRVEGDVPALLGLPPATPPTERDDVASVVVIRKAELRAGEITDGVARNRVTYHLRAPDGYTAPADDAEDVQLPAILILHGSNMNSRAYVHTIASAWPEFASKYVLIGINGERRNTGTSGRDAQYNYSYVNYVGRSKYKGYPGSERESPVLVAEVVRELKDRLPIGRIFVGGHSQGGFLTYSLMMNTPELFAGAFPISAGLIVQCEPSAYDNAEVIERQRRVPLVIVHATNDRVVGFDSGRHAWESFEDAGFPMLRLLADEMGGHMFARLPIHEAIAWLERMTSDDPSVLLETAEKALDAKEERDAIAAVTRLDAMELDAATSARRDEIRKRLEERAEEEARPIREVMEKEGAGGEWIDAFLTYRARFAGSRAAAPLQERYAALRAEQQKLADELFGKARQAFGAGDQKKAKELAERIVKECFASDKYRLAKGWLDE